MDKKFIIAATLIIYKLVLITIGWTARKQTKSIVEYFLGG
jgi:Na+/proline symporter|tara:strand:- start:126 stop:245 length:120 start_codon:yes stop_codon:yes gene_type:complete